MRNRDSMAEGHQFDYGALLQHSYPTLTSLPQMDLSQPGCSSHSQLPTANDLVAREDSQQHHNQSASSTPSTSATAVNQLKAVRMYPCDKCHKSFKQKTQLEQHNRVHSNARPYSCSFCDKSFKQRCHVDQHERIHTNERPYVCAQCGHGFRQKNHLDSHKKSHASGKK